MLPQLLLALMSYLRHHKYPVSQGDCCCLGICHWSRPQSSLLLTPRELLYLHHQGRFVRAVACRFLYPSVIIVLAAATCCRRCRGGGKRLCRVGTLYLAATRMHRHQQAATTTAGGSSSRWIRHCSISTSRSNRHHQDSLHQQNSTL